jgi:hypothetical protein
MTWPQKCTKGSKNKISGLLASIGKTSREALMTKESIKFDKLVESQLLHVSVIPAGLVPDSIR